MNITERELSNGFRRSMMSTIRGERTRHVVTHNPNSANPGEEPYIDIPKTKPSSCIYPGSMSLLFDIEVTGTKSHFLNNLTRQLQKRLQIRVAGETAYDCTHEYLISTYKDLWRSNSERDDMIEYGLANQNLRKLISGDDTGATSGDAQKVSDNLLYGIYSKKQKIGDLVTMVSTYRSI